MQFHMLSSRACIAVAAMVGLERGTDAQPIRLPLLAEHLDLSPSSVEHVIGSLRRRGLVQSVRGPGGGYQLARAARDISVADIIGAVERQPKAGGSKIRGNWPALSRAIAHCLAGVSLQELVDEPAYEAVRLPCSEASRAPRRGISGRPVLEPVTLPRHANTVFALAEALK